MQRQLEHLLGHLPRGVDNPLALKEWRSMVRQADLIVTAMLVLGVGLGVAYAALRWPDQMPAVWRTWLFDQLTQGALFHSRQVDFLDTHSYHIVTGLAPRLAGSESGPWSSALLLYLTFLGGLLFLLGPVSLGGAIAKERENGTWPFVLITPLSEGTIMRGKWLGLAALSGVLMVMALPLLVWFAAGSARELGYENPWLPWFLLGIGGTWFVSLAFLGSAAGLYTASRSRSASRARFGGLALTALIGLIRGLSLLWLGGSPGEWLLWHGLNLGMEACCAWGLYQAACRHCRQARNEDLQGEEREFREGAEEGWRS